MSVQEHQTLEARLAFWHEYEAQHPPSPLHAHQIASLEELTAEIEAVDKLMIDLDADNRGRVWP